MNNMPNYHAVPRRIWQQLQPQMPVTISKEQLTAITSLNDRISLADVEEIYLPLVHLLAIHIDNYRTLQQHKQQLLALPEQRTAPFIIGISGSVSVGKSTTARLLQVLLQESFPDQRVALVTTDGFLYPNEVLKERNIMHRKGFPESYDMNQLLSLMLAVKTGKSPLAFPVYSHTVYDVVPDECQIIDRPDILIVEGINVLQLPATEQIFVSDFFDFAIYVDAEAENIEQWFLERFALHLDLAQDKPDNYYYAYANGDRAEALAMARHVWQTINLVNLTEYILPTRTRADLVLHKTDDHYIDTVYLRKY